MRFAFCVCFMCNPSFIFSFMFLGGFYIFAIAFDFFLVLPFYFIAFCCLLPAAYVCSFVCAPSYSKSSCLLSSFLLINRAHHWSYFSYYFLAIPSPPFLIILLSVPAFDDIVEQTVEQMRESRRANNERPKHELADTLYHTLKKGWNPIDKKNHKKGWRI